MTKIGHAMVAKDMFAATHYAELYDSTRVARDLARLAGEEAEGNPHGFWPDADAQIRGLLVQRPPGSVAGVPAPQGTNVSPKLFPRLVLTYRNAEGDRLQGGAERLGLAGDMDVEVEAGVEREHAPENSQGTSSADPVSSVSSLTYSTPEEKTASPEEGVLPITGAVQLYLTSVAKVTG